MGQRLRVRKARPSLIITSSAKRARQTAKLVAKVIKYPKEFLQVEPELYLAATATILEVIAFQNDEFADMLVVGHNPGLTDLVNQLVPDLELDNLPTAGLVAIDFRADHWSELRHDRGKLAYYDYPKNPEVLVRPD